MDAKDLSSEMVEKAETRTRAPAELSEADRQIQRKLRWKMDLIVLPLLSTVYFLASMVRANIQYHIGPC